MSEFNHQSYVFGLASGRVGIPPTAPIGTPPCNISLTDDDAIERISYFNGWLTGKEIARMQNQKTKEPIAYLYNGVQLPPLPEWDKEKYPYAMIETTTAYEYTHQVYFMQYPFEQREDGYFVLRAPRVRYFCASNTEWEMPYEWESGGLVYSNYSGLQTVWTNTDIYKDGSLVIAASEPVPVYE